MSTRVPDARKCIVFGVEGDYPPSVAVLGLERRLNPVGMPCDLIAKAFEQVADVVVCLMLLESYLGVGMNLYTCQTPAVLTPRPAHLDIDVA